MNSPVKKFHINDLGKAGPCSAKYKCRFGGPDSHYPSEQDARDAFEREMMREQLSIAMVETKAVEPLPSGVIFKDSKGSVAVLPPGEYFIGDPYIMIGTYDQEGWNNYVETVDKTFGWENDVENPRLEKTPLVGASYAGSPVVAVKAFHGSGLHWSAQPPRRIPSDAGLISAMPMKVLEELGINAEIARKKKLGFVHKFDSNFEVKREKNGNIHLGEVLIVVHNDTIPAQAWEALDKGDNEDKIYEENEERDNLRKNTYDRVVTEFLDIEV